MAESKKFPMMPERILSDLRKDNPNDEIIKKD